MPHYPTIFVTALPDGSVFCLDGLPAVISATREDALARLTALLTLEPALQASGLTIVEAAIVDINALRADGDTPASGEGAATESGGAGAVCTPHEESLSTKDRDALHSAGLLFDKTEDTPADARYYALVQTPSFKQIHEIHAMEGIAANGFGQDAFVIFISDGKATTPGCIAQNADIAQNLKKLVRTASGYFRTRGGDVFYPIVDWLYDPRDNSVVLVTGAAIGCNPDAR